MKKKTSLITIISLCVLSIALLTLNLSLSLFGDSIDKSGVIQFKQHKLDIDIVDNESIILSREELTIGSVATRKINIKNPTNSTSCVFRLWIEFYVEGKLDNEYLSLSLDETKFIKNEDGKIFYKGVLSSGGNISDLVLTFKVNEEVLAKEYEGKKYGLKFYIESIQSTKIAIQSDWENDYPTEWWEGIKDNLS